jgi:hypothetical protein
MTGADQSPLIDVTLTGRVAPLGRRGAAWPSARRAPMGFPASPEAKPHCGLTASTHSIVPCCPYSLADGETEPMGSTGLACQSCRVASWALSARASNSAQTIFGWSSRPPSPQSVPAMTLSRPTRLAYLTRRSATSSGCSMKSVAWPTIPGMRTFPLGSLGFQEQSPDNLR